MRLKRIVLFFVLILLLCETSFLYGQYKALRNIGNEFGIIIADFPRKEDFKKIGLTEERLRTVTELRLRREGMKIVTKKEANYKTPHIYIGVTVVELAFSVHLRICEWVELKRLPFPHWTIAAIWDQGFTGIHSGQPEFIVSSLNILFDEFFNDYYKANPKEKKEVRENEERYLSESYFNDYCHLSCVDLFKGYRYWSKETLCKRQWLRRTGSLCNRRTVRC
ncbi:hypothetical protein ES703_37044 [subsurface metagenome]